MNKNTEQRWYSVLVLILGLIPGLYFFSFNIIGINFTYFPGDMADGRLNLYFLEHASKFITGRISSFWDAPFMFPERNVLAYSDNLLGSAPIYSVFRLAGLDIYAAYQCWCIVISALNYISAFYFLRYVFKNNYAAALGAYFFAFSIALQSQLAHAQTFPRFAIPLAFLMAVKFGENLDPKYFFYTILLVVYQIFCGIYLGFMLAVPVGIYLLLIILQNLFAGNLKPDKKWYIKMASSLAINITVLLPLMLPYLVRKIAPSLEYFKQIVHTVPTIKSYFFSQHGSLIWNFLNETAINYEAWWDHQLFAGGIATICLIISFYLLIAGLARIKFRFINVPVPLLLVLTGVITFLLYLRFDKYTAYLILYYLPGFSSMRSLTRIINIELIFFAIATAFVFAKLFNMITRMRFMLFLFALGLIVCDNYFYRNSAYKTEVSKAKSRVAGIESEFAGIPAGSLVSYEPAKMNSAAIYYQLDAMLTAQKYDLITVNGYTATCPFDFSMYWNDPNETTRNFWLGDKKMTFDTLYVVKGPNEIETVEMKDIQKEDYKSAKEKARLEYMINYIRSNKKWMELIETKALKNNISVDSMLILDAKWMLKHGDN